MKVLVIAGYDWQAGAWRNDQPREIAEAARYVTGAEHILGCDPEATRYVLVGTWYEREHARRALDACRLRGIPELERSRA